MNIGTHRNQPVKIALQLIMLVFLFVVSCGKDDEPAPYNPPPSSPAPEETASKLTGRELLDLKIQKADNPSLSEDAYLYRPTTGSNYYMTIPRGFTDRNLKIELVSSEKSTVTVNGTTLTMEVGKSADGSNAAIGKGTIEIEEVDQLSIRVTAEDGYSNTYTVLVQDGIVEIDKMVYPFLIQYGIPAGSFAVGKNSEEEIVYKSAIGYADVNKRERARPYHLFRLASMSKQFTAIAIMTLIQEGKFTIHDKVFGPDGLLKDQWPSVPARAAEITVQHLLEHTLGFDTHDIMFSAASPNTLDRRIDMLLAQPQPNVPGTRYLYSNMGYGLLGKIIEKESGKDFTSYLQEIFEPLGDMDVYQAAVNAQSVREHEATLYAQYGTAGAYGSNIEVYKAAGGVLTNTESLFKMLYAVDGGTKKPDILNSDIRELMFTKSTVANYAKGWRTNHSLFGGFYHGGNLNGTATFWIYGTEYSAAMLLNSRAPSGGNFDTDLIVLVKDIMETAKRLNL